MNNPMPNTERQIELTVISEEDNCLHSEATSIPLSNIGMIKWLPQSGEDVISLSEDGDGEERAVTVFTEGGDEFMIPYEAIAEGGAVYRSLVRHYPLRGRAIYLAIQDVMAKPNADVGVIGRFKHHVRVVTLERCSVEDFEALSAHVSRQADY